MQNNGRRALNQTKIIRRDKTMGIVSRGTRALRGFILSYGPTSVKKRFWDKEFASGKWNFIDNTVGDPVYPALEKYARKGSILDLGCGPGNTANELAFDAYAKYVGVDISESALAKAAKRTEENGRSAKNSFAQSDFLGFEPGQKFDLILFRESMYHVPVGKVLPILAKYSQHLAKDGLFVVRLYTMRNGAPIYRPSKMFSIIADNYDVVDKTQDMKTGAAVIVFRPKA
jgi:SAM-dependent methyltransferase